MSRQTLDGPRWVVSRGDSAYPAALEATPRPPERLFGIGNGDALQEGLAIIGARKATAYGTSLARRFGKAAAEYGIVVISGGAYGCDSEAHRGALEAGGRTVVVLGGGCDKVYPARHIGLFQSIIDTDGAVISEQPWDTDPLPYMFRERNRMIAGLARATLIVEAGVPSGTFSTADEALKANKDVLVVPGAITSPASQGANLLLAQGAIPIIDDETFADAMFLLFGELTPLRGKEGHIDSRMERDAGPCASKGAKDSSAMPSVTEDEEYASWKELVIASIAAAPASVDDMLAMAKTFDDNVTISDIIAYIGEYECNGTICQNPDGKYSIRPKGVQSNTMCLL